MTWKAVITGRLAGGGVGGGELLVLTDRDSDAGVPVPVKKRSA